MTLAQLGDRTFGGAIFGAEGLLTAKANVLNEC
jgi:hypothetical protein